MKNNDGIRDFITAHRTGIDDLTHHCILNSAIACSPGSARVEKEAEGRCL
jgi:hypothetical protein